MSALGLTAVPASAEVVAPTDETTATAPVEQGVEPTAPAADAPVPPADATSEEPAEGSSEVPSAEDAPADPAGMETVEGGDETAETAAPASVNEDGTVTVDVLAFNDFHGRIEANQQSAGAAVLAGAADQLREENEDTVLVSAGDNIGASTFTSFVQDDEPTIKALNGMGLFASAVGNHEFDQGADDLAGRVSDLAEFPYLAANVTPQLKNIDEYKVYTAQEGTDEEVTIGFVGVVTPEVPSLVTPAGIEGLEFGSMLTNANRVADQLSDGDTTNGEADVVVVLAHDGAATADRASATGSSDFGALVNGANENIDAIVSGHTHVLYSHDVNGMAVTQASQYGEYLTKLSFTVDPESGDIVAPTAVEQLDLVKSVRNADGSTTYTPNYPADTTIETLVEDAKGVAEERGAVELGAISADLNRARQTDGTENRGGESTLGNFVADVHLWATQELGAEIAFMNPGGLRKDLTFGEDGVVTFKEAAEVQPFANTLVTKELTGEQIYQVLEEQWQPAIASRPFLKLGVSAGFEYLYDPAGPAGERVLGATLNDEPIDLDATYKVVMNSFLASGGDNFATFAEGTNSADSGRVDLQATVDYFAAQEGTPVEPDLAQRAVGVSVSGDLVPGAKVTFHLSSLDFSTTEENATEVQLHMGPHLLGTAPIDGTIVNTTDEVGRATIRATIPTAPGVYEFAVLTDVGTDVAFPLELEGTGGHEQEFGFFLNDEWTSKANHVFHYGRFSDEVLIGDWDGDGTDSITVRRGNVFYVNNEPRGGQAERVFVYGRPGDTVLVGDWDGDGVDTLAVRRGAQYHVKNSLTGGPADKVVGYGRAGDQVVVGDWDGDGDDTFTVRRGSVYHVKNTIAGGAADKVVAYGRADDVTLAGDWNGDSQDTFAVRRGNVYHIKNSVAGGKADLVLAYGRATDEVYVGDWNGDGTDTLGVRRLP